MTHSKAMRDRETVAQAASGVLSRPPIAPEVEEVRNALLSGEIDVKYGFAEAMTKSIADGLAIRPKAPAEY